MNSRARNCAIAAAAAILSFAAAQPAHATRTYVDYDSLVVVAGSGQTNLVTIKPHPTTSGAYLIIDAGSDITPGRGCSVTPIARVATCTLADEYGAAPSLTLSLRDGADMATVEGSFYILQADGGYGDDRLELPGSGGFESGYTHVSLGAGKDTLKLGASYWADSVQVTGGDGNDHIDAADSYGGYYYGDRGDDTIIANGWVSGGDGADTLDGTGMFGWDHYYGDAGDDSINTNDQSFDVVDCGPGLDALDQDDTDEFSNCEL